MPKRAKRAAPRKRAPRGGAPRASVLVAFRVTPDLAARLDELAKALSTPWHEVRRGQLARLAMERGLAAIESEPRPPSVEAVEASAIDGQLKDER